MKPFVMVTFRTKPIILEEIDGIAKDKELTRSDLIRMALDKLIREHRGQ